MTALITQSTLYIPLPKGFSTTFRHRDQLREEKDQQQQQQAAADAATRATSVSSSSSSSSSSSDGDDSSSDDGSFDEEHQGSLHLLNLGNAPPNNIVSDRINAKVKQETEETMYFSCFLLLISKPFFNVFCPHVVKEGTHELRELLLYRQAETFQFADEIGFGPDVPLDLCISSIKPLARFLKSVDKRGAPGDLTEFTELLVNCPALKNIHFEIFDRTNSALVEFENFLQSCVTLIQRHRSMGVKGQAARRIGIMCFDCSSLHRNDYFLLLKKYKVLEIVRKVLLENSFNNAIAFRDFFVCLEAIILLENSNSNTQRIPLDNITPMSEFTECIDLVEAIFENGDDRFLRNDEILPFLLNFFVKIVAIPRCNSAEGFVVTTAYPNAIPISNPSVANNPAVNANAGAPPQQQQQQQQPQQQFLHPCLKRKMDFINRYRDTLIPKLINLIRNIPTLEGLDADIIIRVFALLVETLTDGCWSEDFFGPDFTWTPERWKAMVESGRSTLEHFPWEYVTDIFHRIASSHEKYSSGLLPCSAYLAAAVLRQFYANEQIDHEYDFCGTPLLVKSRLIEEYVSILKLEKYDDGEPIEIVAKGGIISNLIELVRHAHVFGGIEIPRQGYQKFPADCARMFVKSTSIARDLITFTRKEAQKILDKMCIVSNQESAAVGNDSSTGPIETTLLVPGQKTFSSTGIFDFLQIPKTDKTRLEIESMLRENEETLHVLASSFQVVARIQSSCGEEGDYLLGELINFEPLLEEIDNFVHECIKVIEDIDEDEEDEEGSGDEEGDDDDDDDDDNEGEMTMMLSSGTRRTRGGRAVAAAPAPKTTSRRRTSAPVAAPKRSSATKPKPKPKAKKVAQKKKQAKTTAAKKKKPAPKAKKPSPKAKKPSPKRKPSPKKRGGKK